LKEREDRVRPDEEPDVAAAPEEGVDAAAERIDLEDVLGLPIVVIRARRRGCLRGRRHRRLPGLQRNPEGGDRKCERRREPSPSHFPS
jgi:hypothetical protein